MNEAASGASGAGGAGDDILGLVGQSVDGQLLVESFVGAGRATCVYRARHLVLEAPVALQCATVTNPEALERAQQGFVDAVRLHYRLERKTLHVARVMSQGSLTAPTRTRGGEKVPYLVREWFEGGALARHLAERRSRGLGGRTLGEALQALAPVARALELAHDEQIVHLAVNPRTVLLPGDEPAEGKLAEFGYAGTKVHPLRPPLAAYAAPEQLAGDTSELTAAADVYSLALLVLELLRDLPVHAIDATRDDVLQATGQATRRAADPALPRDARDVLTRALSTDPAKRPRDAKTFWTELTAATPLPLSPPLTADDWDPDAVTAPKLLVPGAGNPLAVTESEPTLRTAPPPHMPRATPSFDALAASQNKFDGASVDIDMSSAPSFPVLPLVPRGSSHTPSTVLPPLPKRPRPGSPDTTVRITRHRATKEVLVAVASFLVVSALGFAAVFYFGDSPRDKTAPTPAESAPKASTVTPRTGTGSTR